MDEVNVKSSTTSSNNRVARRTTRKKLEYREPLTMKIFVKRTGTDSSTDDSGDSSEQPGTPVVSKEDKKKNRVGSIVKRLRCAQAATDDEANAREAQIRQTRRVAEMVNAADVRETRRTRGVGDKQDQRRHRCRDELERRSSTSTSRSSQQQRQSRQPHSNRPLAGRRADRTDADRRERRLPSASKERKQGESSEHQPPVPLISVEDRKRPVAKRRPSLMKNGASPCSPKLPSRSATPQPLLSTSPPPIYRASSMRSSPSFKPNLNPNPNRVRWDETILQYEIPANTSLIDDLSTIDGADDESALTGMSVFSAEFSELTYDGADPFTFDPYNDILDRSPPSRSPPSLPTPEQMQKLRDAGFLGTSQDPRDLRQPMAPPATAGAIKSTTLVEGVVSDLNLMANILMSDGKQFFQCVSDAARETLVGTETPPQKPTQLERQRSPPVQRRRIAPRRSRRPIHLNT